MHCDFFYQNALNLVSNQVEKEQQSALNFKTNVTHDILLKVRYEGMLTLFCYQDTSQTKKKCINNKNWNCVYNL